MTCGRAWPRCLDRVGQRLELRRAARDQHERMAVVGEHIRKRRADAGGAPVIRATGLTVRHGLRCPANFAITSCGMGFDLIFSGSSGSRAAQTRVSKHSTQSSPSSVMRCCTSKLERRNSATLVSITTSSPNLVGLRKRARVSTIG